MASTQDDVAKLQAEIDLKLKEFLQISKEDLQFRRKILDNQVKESIELYQNQIRNLGILSGVVAPFSLTLLNVETLDLNVTLLIFGFVVLLLNIILSLFFLHYFLRLIDTRIVKAELKWFAAESDKKAIIDNNFATFERTMKVFDYTKNIDELDDLTGISALNSNLQKDRGLLRRNARRIVFLFTLGTTSIILSVFVEPLIYHVYNLTESLLNAIK
jgi:hypothetical protein